MDKLTVYQLKCELKARGRGTTGNKADLVASLRDALDEEGIDFESWAEFVPSKAAGIFNANENMPQASAALPSGQRRNTVEITGSGEAPQISDTISIQTSASAAEMTRLKLIEEDALRAGLEAQLKIVLEKQELDRKMSELARQKEILEYTEAIEISRAKVRALGRHEDHEIVESNRDKETPRSISNATNDTNTTNRRSHDGHLNTESSNIAGLLRREREITAGLMRLPPVELPKFGGDVTEFPHFMKAFNLKIASKLSTDEERLFYLEQNMIPESKPHSIVTACLYLDNGYEEAKNLLTRRYGSESVLAAAFVDQFENLLQLKPDDIEGLDHFALELMKCKNAFGVNSAAMSDPRTLRSISAKLPVHSQHRWRHRADSINENEGRAVVFDDLVNFVVQEARVATNPVFGNRGSNATVRQNNSVTVGRFRSKPLVAATRMVSAGASPCIHCQDKGHELTDCSCFAKLPHQDKIAIIRDSALCYGCLKQGHRSTDCRRRASCSICASRHPTSLHINRSGGNSERSENGVPNVTSCTTKGGASVSFRPALPIVPVVLHHGLERKCTLAFLDSGSTHSFISEGLLKTLKLQSLPQTRLSLTTVDREVSITTRIVNGAWLSDENGGNILELPQLFSLEKIPVDFADFPTQTEISKWKHLEGVKLDLCQNEEVELLLGSNAFLAMEPLEVVTSNGEGGPFAVRTRYGWVVSGLRGVSSPFPAKCYKTLVHPELQHLEGLVQQLYNKEHEENLHSNKMGPSVEDKKWEKFVHASTRLIKDHYEVGLPVVDEGLILPNNRNMAASRLLSLRNKLRRSDKLASDYKLYMKNMLQNGFAEPVPNADLSRNDGKVWYLPHHAVQHPQKPDKVRIVFDGAATFKGISLNDNLLQGPDQTNALLDVLTRFRMENIAFTADIENMFHQVYVPESDRDLFRFLWWKDGDPQNDILEYRMKVHVFGATSSPSIACFALRKTALDNRGCFSNESCATIEKNFYVDDLLKAMPDEGSAILLLRDLMVLCKRGGFTLKKISSNSSALIASIPSESRSKQLAYWTSDSSHLPTERVLGVIWDTEQDVLKMALDHDKLVARPMTRRGLLSAVSSLYDPIGMSCPSMLKGRLILQELSRLHNGWDDSIPLVKQQEWTAWLSALNEVNELSVNRCVKPDNFGDVVSCQLHHFADASEVAYGTVSYIRLTNAKGQICCSFLKGKMHLAPLKGATIPRLELMAATTAVKICSLIGDTIEFDDVEHIFWTDSTTVLRYIQNKAKRFHTFVANRLAIIHDGSRPEQWRYVNSSDNPADDVSRGVQSKRWLNGPEFLWKDKGFWPSAPIAFREVTEDDPEVRKTAICAKTAIVPDSETPMERLILHYSQKESLLRGLSWLSRFTRSLKEGQKGFIKMSPPLCYEEQREAEKKIIRHIQEHEFPREYENLSVGAEVPRTSRLVKLHPFMQDGIIRVGGRLAEASILEETKHPIVIPSRGHFTELLITDAHEAVGHSGRQFTLAKLRKRFWILKGISSVRRVLNSCLSCTKLYRPPESQQMANLPSDRVQAQEPPFTRTGVDYFGPFYVTQGRSQVKRYGVIFTCLAIRAVHLEVAENLTSDSFICALRRFVARRGNVQILRSDNGTNFTGANRELRLEMTRLSENEHVLQRAMLKRGITWKFDVAGASHHGGVWERQIRSIRRILESLLTSQSLKEETLRTIFCEVENILNSRPLTPVSSDVRDDPPLSPNDILLLGGHGVTLPFGVFSQADHGNRKKMEASSSFRKCFLDTVEIRILTDSTRKARYDRNKKELSTRRHSSAC
ncbi:uncharacterized protein LOC122368999 [Amphibalanus amphitrite]|uniref:uncharacterized protein LOC122368999 n=1 Tax=Amphibalanus amphitrite TaxID=1232801 RepID=UPI001C917B10|nr:uncharacterized protein LOC122368999 [Amphibalanus amphitrite]